jgi:hypothetical protein
MTGCGVIESKGGFELSLEITVKAFLAGYTITEIPSTWRDRTAGISRFKLWKWLPHYLKWYFMAIQPRGEERWGKKRTSAHVRPARINAEALGANHQSR